jgi:acyl transferase domain-containing protein
MSFGIFLSGELILFLRYVGSAFHFARLTLVQIPAERFQLERYTSTDAKSGWGMKVHTANFIDCPDEFDHKFFKVSPREAKSMDPSQRIFLHTPHDALESARYVPDATASFQRDSFGCFISTATHDYADHLLRGDIDVHYSTGMQLFSRCDCLC